MPTVFALLGTNCSAPPPKRTSGPVQFVHVYCKISQKTMLSANFLHESTYVGDAVEKSINYMWILTTISSMGGQSGGSGVSNEGCGYNSYYV
ncbi:MAG: hypothetical protein Q9170_002110 [Blastenia crenularia]